MGIEAIANLIAQAVRALAALAFAMSLVVAATHWATRKGTLAAFGPWAKWVRSWSDPLLHRVERLVVRAGGNPQDAPGWLIAAAVVVGLIMIATVDWLLNFILGIAFSVQAGQGASVILVDTLFSVLMGALLIRVISSWVGISPYSAWMRPVVLVTDWMLLPIRRVLPATGAFDFSPMVAYFLLYFVRNLLLQNLMRGM